MWSLEALAMVNLDQLLANHGFSQDGFSNLIYDSQCQFVKVFKFAFQNSTVTPKCHCKNTVTPKPFPGLWQGGRIWPYTPSHPTSSCAALNFFNQSKALFQTNPVILGSWFLTFPIWHILSVFRTLFLKSVLSVIHFLSAILFFITSFLASFQSLLIT